MKILYIDTPLKTPGGGQWSLFHILKNIDKKRFRFKVFIPYYCQFYDLLRRNNIDVEIVKMIELSYKIKNFGTDIIHCNSATTKYTFVAAFTAKFLGIPFIWHNRVVETAGWKEQLIAGLSSKIIVISDAVKEKFRMFQYKVVKIYNAVDIDLFKPDLDVYFLRIKLGLNKDTKIIGIFSRLDWWKGHRFVIDVFKNIQQKFKDIKLLIVGEGPEYGKVIKYAEESGVMKNIIFLGYREDIPQLINLCDIVLNPSTEPEPFGRTLIEAMSCGKIVIASDLGGHKEIIRNNEDGILLPLDVSIWTEKIIEVLSDEALIQKISISARKKVLENFSIKDQVNKIEEIYNTFISKNE